MIILFILIIIFWVIGILFILQVPRRILSKSKCKRCVHSKWKWYKDDIGLVPTESGGYYICAITEMRALYKCGRYTTRRKKV